MKSGLLRGNRLFLFNLTLFAAGYLFIVMLPFPALKEHAMSPTAVEILDRAGTPLYVAPLADGMRRQFRGLDEIPADVRRIFILAEDKRFYLHFGVDPLALARSVFRFIVSGDSTSGASTISMQLARMVLDRAGPRTGGRLERKIKEIMTAVRIEARLDKERILELWLNLIPFGYQTEGVAAAAQRFFDADLYSLTTAQLFALALIPRNPSAYSPINEPERVSAAVLRLAGEIGIPLNSETVSADISQAAWGRWPDEAPHFSRAVLAAAGEEGRGGRIVTSLDRDLQRRAENLLQVHLDRSVESRIENGALLVVENLSGEILAYVGSQGFSSPEAGQIDGVRVANQPGSTIKPFLYAYALEQGFRPNDILADVPTDFGGAKVYVPRNFDREYNGPVRIRTALASSLNVPATSLLERLGVRQFASFLLDLGLRPVTDGNASGFPDAGLGIALGNAPVTLYDLVRAFSIFPRGGMYRDLTWRLRAEETADAERRVISRSTAWIIFDMLSDPAERVTGFGMDDPFRAGRGAAVKTGTSSRSAHIWALAASSEYTVGVWLGNFAGDTVIGRTGSSVPARIALEILSRIEAPGASATCEPPSGLRLVEICSLSGMAAGPRCPATRREYFSGEAPPVCTFHVEDPATFSSTVYPREFASWAAGADRIGSFTSSAAEATEIRYPIEGAVYFFDKQLPPNMQAVRVEVLHRRDGKPVLFVNGESAAGPPSESNSVMTSWIVPLTVGPTVLEVRSDGAIVTRRYEVR